ncbi:MAG: T9SS type A sorting domain-containing protein [Bacteroidota bacterium]
MHPDPQNGIGTVEITRFSGARIQNLITLNWNTIGEKNNLGFEIERKSQYDHKWRTVGFVHGRGTAIGDKGYAFVERLTAREVLLYRLKQIDTFGNYLYSQALTVTPDQIPASMRVSAEQKRHVVEYNRISFALPNESVVRVTVHDIYGREVSTVAKELLLSPGYHVIPFGSDALPAGTYAVRLRTADGTYVQTLIKTL